MHATPRKRATLKSLSNGLLIAIGWNSQRSLALLNRHKPAEENVMGFGRGALLWLLGVPLPIIILLAIFWHH